MIEIVHLVKEYGKFRAVNDVTLTVQEGEIFGFLGVNGAGKTTTLRMLAGILKPTSGTIRIGGFDLATHPTEAKTIVGYIPDRPYLYAKLTGREFLYFVADLYLVPNAEVDGRIDALLLEYGLSEWQHELVESYSHGMKQRLATCAALIHKPRVLIVDEPMVGLDPHGARLLKDRFRHYASSGMSILLSTHSLDVAQEVADRLAIIDQGTIIATGTFEELRAQTGAQEQNLEHVFLKLTKSPMTNGEFAPAQ
jgi:ABC-2 type transport system ATP-binding protein